MTDQFRFSTPIRVRFNETDLQGHVNFGHFLFYFDVGLVEYLEAIGYDYQTMLAEGADMLYIESHCNYKSPARWPEVLDILTRVGHFGNTSLRFDFEVRARPQDSDPLTQIDAADAAAGRLVATGHIVTVTVERAGMTPTPIPPRMRGKIETFENTETGA